MRAKTISVVLISVLASTLLAWSAPAGACAEDVRIQEYKVTAKPSQKAYAFGDTVIIKGRVTDRITKEGAEDVQVGLAFAQKDNFAWGMSLTNRKGRYVAKVEATRKMFQVGWVDMTAYAYKRQADGVCVTASGGGDSYKDNAFRIRRR